MMPLVVFLGACIETPQPNPVEPEPSGTCADACATLERLGCEEAKPTPGRDETLGTEDDGTCLAICETAEDEGRSLNPGCVSHVESCDVVSDCQR